MTASAMTEPMVPPPVSASRKAAMWIVAVFILGAALGVAGGYLFGVRVAAAPPAPMSDEAKRHQKVAELTRVLDLTAEQQTQIDAIFLDTAGKFKDVRKQADAQIETFRQAGRERVRAVLTPEQLPKFEEFLRKLDENRRKNPPPPH